MLGFLAYLIVCWDVEMMGYSSCFRALLMSRSGLENGQADGSIGCEGDESRSLRDGMENSLALIS